MIVADLSTLFLFRKIVLGHMGRRQGDKSGLWALHPYDKELKSYEVLALVSSPPESLFRSGDRPSYPGLHGASIFESQDVGQPTSLG